MTSRGNGYNTVDAIEQAIAVAGVTPEAFFRGAQMFTRTNGFNAQVAAVRFQGFLIDRKGDPEIPQAVQTFADWVLTKDSRAIANKFASFGGAIQIPPH